MKNILLILLTAFCLTSLSSCEDYLNVSPDMGVDESDVFKSYESVRGHLDLCIRALPDYVKWNHGKVDRAHTAAFSDEAAYTYSFISIKDVLNTGQWLGREGATEVGWKSSDTGQANGLAIANAYYCLRIANRILEKVPSLPFLTTQQANELMGQAYFYRAFYHQEIIKRWGGVAYVDRLYTADEDLDFPRQTYQECANRIIDDLNLAIELLPKEWAAVEFGRPDKLAAMAVKSMAELYAASPLMQNNLYTLDNKGYNVARCEKAAEYANDVLKYIASERPEKAMMQGGIDNYSNVFYHRKSDGVKFVSDEALWYKNGAGVNRDESVSIHFQNIRISKRSGNYGWSITTPSQNLVDMFEVINPNDGKAYPITDPRSQYSLEHPYENRDPRFYYNIFYPGDEYGQDANGNKIYLEPWEKGRDHEGGAGYTRSVPTGYMCKKWWWPEANAIGASGRGNGYGLCDFSTSFIRTTQIYLDYAEAMNEAYGPNVDPKGYGMTAVDAINEVRNRVGMPSIIDEFTSSKDAFRDRIRNERAIELMFENHRWWDIRRWMIAEEVLKDGIFGVDVTYATNNMSGGHKAYSKESNFAELKFSIKHIPNEMRVFEKKHYWYPMPLNHVDMLENTLQNPGW